MPFKERREHPGVSARSYSTMRLVECCQCTQWCWNESSLFLFVAQLLIGGHYVFAVYLWMLTVVLLLLPGQGAVSTAEFVGVKLKDVLKLAGLDDPAAARDERGIEHVIFYGRDGMQASSE